MRNPATTMPRMRRALQLCSTPMAKASGSRSKKTAPSSTPAPRPIKRCMRWRALTAMKPPAKVEHIANEVKSSVIIKGLAGSHCCSPARMIFCPGSQLLFVQLAQGVEHEIGVAVCLDGDGEGLRGALEVERAVGQREGDAQARV